MATQPVAFNQPLGGIPVTGSAAPATTGQTTALQPVGATTASNPYAAPAASGTGAIPTIEPGGVTQNPSGTVAQSNGINWVDGSHTVIGDFKDTYGAGTGIALTSALQGLGTTTSNAVQATIDNTDYAATKEYANIQASEAAAGISPNSSTAALASGDFYSGVNSQLQQTISSAEEGEQSELISALQSEGTAHGSDSSGWDTLGNILSGAGSSILGGVGSIAQGASSAISASNPGADTGWLDAIGLLG